MYKTAINTSFAFIEYQCTHIKLHALLFSSFIEINLDKVLSEDREKEESEAAAAAAVGNQTNLEGEDAAEDGEDVDAEGGDDAEDADENVDDDYADTYFDNGENFLDPDDDALEEGAVF